MKLPVKKYQKILLNYKEKAATTSIKAGLRGSFKAASGLPLPLTFLRNAMELSAGIFKVRSDVQVERLVLGGVNAEQLNLKSGFHQIAEQNYALLHFHGGVFVAGSAATHRALGGEIAARSGATVYMLDYRLAPQHRYPAALDDCLAAYQALLAKGYLPEHIILGGDSAGGALVLATLVALRELKVALPAAALLISPFVDMTLCADSFKKNALRDPMLTKEILKRGADAYRGDIQSADARVSPVFADLTGLPPMLIQVGTEEVLLDDALQLAKRAERSGIAVDCHVYDGMWHNFQMFNALLKTSDQALDEIAQFIKNHVK
ncbi:MAG: alpha/beta hydrolase [Gammaproteobacteria bacterium]|nr:alpha/beta hydrolase [Gammaproteobacteria bacterium]